MRKTFAKLMVEAASDPNLFFFTGDLGFMALEDVSEAFKERFINSGVAAEYDRCLCRYGKRGL